MQACLVSILMPAFNAERYIARAVESALAQTYPDWELLVVDDGSTDRTAEILAGYPDPRIRVFQQPNGGESSARNTALQYAQGTYIAFLDADDEYLPEHLEVSCAYLQRHPDVDGVYSDGYYIDEQGVRIKPLSARRRGSFSGDIFAEMVRASDVFGAPLCVVLKRELIVRQQLQFDPQITIGPDWDFLTAYSETARFGRIEQKTCLYRVHSSNVSLQTNPQRRLQSLARCREKTIRMRRFGECPVETREFVFYDLLVNLLDNPMKQQEITSWIEFHALPQSSQARLLRLIASRVLLQSGASHQVEMWLKQAGGAQPPDLRARLLYSAYRIHPWLCRALLQLKNPRRIAQAALTPFADLAEG